MLEFRGVSRTYGETTAVHPLDLAVEEGEVMVLLGPSGCGKTTILRMAAGLVAPSRGEVVIDATPVEPRTIGAIRKRLGYVIQEGGLFPHLTGLANVTIMARQEGWPHDQIKRRVDELVEMTQFPKAGLDRYPSELSGGQRQRLSLMRALFLHPRVLLLDEPLGALDPLIRAGLQRDLKQVFDQTGMTVLFVTHDLVEASRFADRVCLMQSGRVAQQGPFREIIDAPATEFVREFVNSQVVAA